MRQLKIYFFVLCILNFIILDRCETVCDKSKCQGPIRYYNDLKCIPMLATSDDCCPYQYNCDHLKKRLPNNCYIGNSVYNINDDLAEYDTNPCNAECTCRKTNKSHRARFYCSVIDCPINSNNELSDGCYLRRNLTQCCAEVVCYDEILSWCMVDGEIYMSGEEFIPKSNPDKICHCYQGHSKDVNAELHCRDNDRLCNSELYFPYNESCVPVYFLFDSPQYDCSFIYRCYNQDDWIIRSDFTHLTKIESNTVCKFGDLTLNYGDQLAPGITYDTCMNCTCEVGPMLTCRRFSDEICRMKLKWNEFIYNL